MKRAAARGRMLPQSLSTDPRYGRLSLKAQVLYPLMWANCDDQGRLSGDPDEIKYAVCPNVDHISKTDIPELLKELETQEFLKVYNTSKTRAVQMLDWWEEQRLQWAWPSRYPPPPGWKDRLRYKPNPKEEVKENWLPPSQLGSELGSQPPDSLPSAQGSSPLTTPSEKEKGEEKRRRRRRGRGNIPGVPPSSPGSNSPSPSPTTSSPEILKRLTECFKREWGRVPADRPWTVIPREPDARESAQLRDLAEELSAAGGCPLDYINQAFREAAGQVKMHISYVRAVLHAWLGIGRGPPG